MLLAQDDFFWKKGVQVGHKSAEGIPSYIFKTKIIPKLSRKEIRWDSTKGEKTEYKQLGPFSDHKIQIIQKKEMFTVFEKSLK